MAITRNSVGDPAHKACFCDGSCKESGFCGGDRGMRIDAPPLKYEQEHIAYKNKAQELKYKAQAAQKERKEAQIKKAQKLYETLLPEFEKAAADGGTKYLVKDYLLKGCDLDTFNTLMADEGFVTSNANDGLYVRWDDEPLYNIR